MPDILKSIAGRELGIGHRGQLISNDIEITRPCVDATITVGADSTNVRAITIQLKDVTGDDIDYVDEGEIVVFAKAARTAYATTGGSTGLAIGTHGALLTLVAKKRFTATSEADGDIDLTWTDTGTESVAIGVKLPTGRFVMTGAFANA